MKIQDALKIGIETGDMISKTYLEDLTDDEMMHRPHPKCNHIKWQIGHLIASDNEMVNGCRPGALPDLPEGFKEKYSTDMVDNDNAADFHSKSDLMELYQNQRQATMDILEQLSDEDLQQPAPEAMRSYAPTVASVFSMLGTHWMMHAGQWAVIRRQLGREPVI